jgi:branched-chain amino acid transport system ATP-binding protein
LRQRFPAIIASQPTHGTPAGGALTPIVVRTREHEGSAPTCTDAVLLDVRGVGKNFGGVRVLDDVNLQIRPGEIHGLVGPNGAGKSTLLNIISGALAPNEGAVFWLGAKMNGLPAWRRSRAGIGRTFQKPLVVPNLTVVENIALGSVLRTGPTLRRISMTDHLERAADAGSRLGLGKMLNMDGGALGFSGQRIVEIARALVGEPMLICLDEATSGLDVNERHEIREVLETVRAGGVALCVVEHDTELIATLCDRVTVLDHGVVIAQESGHAVFKDRSVIQSYFGERQQTHVDVGRVDQH